MPCARLVPTHVPARGGGVDRAMVQESIFLMSVFDLAVIGVVIFAFGCFYTQINIVRKSGTYFGFYLSLIGLSTVGLFHLIHLSVVLVGTSLIVAGLVLTRRGVLALVGSLEAAARDLPEELGAHNHTAEMLNSTERHLAKILEIAPAAIISIDRDHRIRVFSAAAPS